MVYRNLLDLCAATILVVWFVGPMWRKHVASKFLKLGDFKQGAASAVCSRCHETTHRFTHPAEGGTRCHKCAGWA